jgi:hypothetical protein
MSHSMQSQVCCIAGCARPACDGGLHPEEALCAFHAQASSPELLSRLQSVVRRSQRLDRIWADEPNYDSVVASGRYLKLCDASRFALDQVDAAWTRLKLDLILTEARRRSARPDDQARSASIAS